MKLKDNGSFNFPVDYRNNSLFAPGWDCSTDLQLVALSGKAIDTSALDWNKFKFVKCKDMDSDNSSKLFLLICVRVPFNKGVIPLFPFNTLFSHFLLCLQRPYDSRKSSVCLHNASSSCFVFYTIILFHWELVLHFGNQDQELVSPPNHFPMPNFCKQA